MKKAIAKVVFGLPIEGPFDYAVASAQMSAISVGSRVLVPFRTSRKIGYVVDFVASSSIKNIKEVISVLDEQPLLTRDTLRWLKEAADYYYCSWGEMIEASLPVGLRKKKTVLLGAKIIPGKPHQKAGAKVVLIHDESLEQRRWEYFLKIIRETIESGRQVIFLEPEKTYFERTLKRLRENFDCEIAALHSGLSEKQEVGQWAAIKEDTVSLVVGTRLVVFAPCERLGLIIINEEDAAAYKQEQGPFYHAREIALLRACQQKARVVLASSTPSLESYYYADRGRYESLHFEDVRQGVPVVEIIDVTREPIARKKARALLSFRLEQAIQKVRQDSGKSLLFLNRAGFATALRCNTCGYSVQCERCNVALTYHYQKKVLVCRFCHYQTEPVDICPKCKSSYIRYGGAGTEKLESEASRLFPGARIVRWDSETGIKDTAGDILISTQVALRGYPHVELAGIVQFDSWLNRVDFRASEKAYALLKRLSYFVTQKMLIQTSVPGHECLRAFAASDAAGFYKQELRQRRELGFAPFRHLVQIQLRGPSEQKVESAALALFEKLKSAATAGVDILEPFYATPLRLRGAYRWNILLKGKSVATLTRFLRRTLKGFKRASAIITAVTVDA